MPPKTGQKLLRFDRSLGARYVAGVDEAGRGSLAGPLVVAGVLLDYDCLRDRRVRPLALLNDSKQVSPAGREELFRAVVCCAARISVRVIPPGEITTPLDEERCVEAILELKAAGVESICVCFV